MRWVAPVVVAIAMTVTAPDPASADHVDDLIDETNHGATAKDQRSAAMQLHKTADPRALRACAHAAVNHPDKIVRAVAAISLRKLVRPQTPSADRALAERALQHAAKKDKDPFVRKQAGRALRRLAPPAPPAPPPPAPGPPRP